MVKPRLILILWGDKAQPRPRRPARRRSPRMTSSSWSKPWAEATLCPASPAENRADPVSHAPFRRPDAGRRAGAFAYSTLDDPANSQSRYPRPSLRHAAEFGADTVLATAPGDWRLRAALQDTPLHMQILPDDRFLCSEPRICRLGQGPQGAQDGMVLPRDAPQDRLSDAGGAARVPAGAGTLTPKAGRPRRYPISFAPPPALCPRSRHPKRAGSGRPTRFHLGPSDASSPLAGPSPARRPCRRWITSSPMPCRALAPNRMRCWPAIPSCRTR